MAQHDQIATTGRILLDHNEICTFGDRGTGKDAHGLTGFYHTVKPMARRRFANDLEHRVGLDLCLAQGIAIHRGGRERRLGAGGNNIARQHTARGLTQRDRFHFGGGDEIKEMRQGVADRDHSASYRPDLPPSFSTTRRPPISMPLSTALAIS